MNTYRRNSIVAGILFIIGTVAGLLSASFSGVLKDSDYLMKISSSENIFLIAIFFQFLMAAACAGIAISLYPVLKRHSEGLALGSVGFRLMESIFQTVGAVILVLLLTLSQEFAKAGAPHTSHFQTIGDLLLSGRDWVTNVAMLLTWSIGAIMYYWIFYKTKLIPLWLSAWGLVGIILTISSSILVMFHAIDPMSTIQVVSNIPIALQEMALAVWLIAKGFNQSAIASLPKNI